MLAGRPAGEAALLSVAAQVEARGAAGTGGDRPAGEADSALTMTYLPRPR